MKQEAKIKHSLAGSLLQIFLLFETLIFFTFLNDISNVPNLLFLVMFSLIFAPFVLYNLKIIIYRLPSIFVFLNIIFFIGFILAFVFSEDEYKSFLGEYGRLNGLLTWICIVIVTAWSFLFLNKSDQSRVIQLFRIIGLFQTFFAFMQILKIDLFVYSNQNLNIAGTFAQSNFLSAFLGISAVCFLALMFKKDVTAIKKLVLIITVGLQLFVIFKSDSSQGFFAFALGSSILILLKIRGTKPRLLFIVTSAIFSVVGFLGLLGHGPISQFVYQNSIALRGDYFRSAWSMFRENWLFGVGLDDFGSYYLFYRDSLAANRDGSDQVFTNYAHNDFLQFAATGGIMLAIPYLMFVFYLIYKIMDRFRQILREKAIFEIDEWLIYITWILFLLISQISIQKVSLLSWNAVITGIMLQRLFYRRTGSDSIAKLQEKGLFFGVGIVLIILISFVYIRPKVIAERSIVLATKTVSDVQNQQYFDYLVFHAKRAIDFQPKEVRYRLLGIQVIYNYGDRENAKSILNESIQEWPRNHYLWQLKALIAQTEGSESIEIEARRELQKLDPLKKSNNDRLAVLLT
jgi:O-antigen ligase